MPPTLPVIPPPFAQAYGLPCLACGRAACFLRPGFLAFYGRGEFRVDAGTVYLRAGLPAPRDGDPIVCQFCDHAQGLGYTPLDVGLYSQTTGQPWPCGRN